MMNTRDLMFYGSAALLFGLLIWGGVIGEMIYGQLALNSIERATWFVIVFMLQIATLVGMVGAIEMKEKVKE